MSNTILLRLTVKVAVLYVYMPFRISLWRDLSLDTLIQKYLILQFKLLYYKEKIPSTKHQKSLSA